jgi:hypothetical protein
VLDADPLTEFLAWVRPRWHADAACKEHPELNWFPERGDRISAELEVCAGCLVRAECAAAGAAADEVGVWGGLSANARRKARPAVGQHAGPQRATAERLKVIAAMRDRGATSEAIAARLGISLNALNSLERRYPRAA